MSGVVLRCPVCGTTQNHPGECDACSDDQVRYFCGNHDPGRWLDAPTCRTCGAVFGEAPRRPPTSPTRPPSPRRPATATRRSESRAPIPSRGEDDPPRGRTRDSEVAPSLADLVARMLAARWRGTGGPMTREPPWESAPEFRLPTLPIKGCLIRLVVLGLVLVAIAIVAMLLLVGGVLQTFDV
jgi:hypothetical protein